jgi:hypothetical protein
MVIIFGGRNTEIDRAQISFHILIFESKIAFNGLEANHKLATRAFLSPRNLLKGSPKALIQKFMQFSINGCRTTLATLSSNHFRVHRYAIDTCRDLPIPTQSSSNSNRGSTFVIV